jgi:hypothetical protein
MSELWLLPAVLLPAVVALCRDLIALCCQLTRRASLERIISAASGRVMISDSAADGASLVVDVQSTVAVTLPAPATKGDDK